MSSFKKTTTALFVLFVICVVLFSEREEKKEEKKPQKNDFYFSIPQGVLTKEYIGASGKCYFEIKLHKKVSLIRIKKISTYLKSRREKTCDGRIIYIDFTLKGNSFIPKWAISSFEPDLKAEIVGIEKSREKIMLSEILKNTPKTEVVGVWRSERNKAYYLIRKSGKEVFLRTLYWYPSHESFSPPSEEKITQTSFKGRLRYNRPNSQDGIYILEEKNGNIGWYLRSGKNLMNV